MFQRNKTLNKEDIWENCGWFTKNNMAELVKLIIFSSFIVATRLQLKSSQCFVNHMTALFKSLGEFHFYLKKNIASHLNFFEISGKETGLEIFLLPCRPKITWVKEFKKWPVTVKHSCVQHWLGLRCFINHSNGFHLIGGQLKLELSNII